MYRREMKRIQYKDGKKLTATGKLGSAWGRAGYGRFSEGKGLLFRDVCEAATGYIDR
jgi:hypothetical protein